MDSPEGKTYQPFDTELGSRVLFESYRFSQGDLGLQGKIFQYLHFLRPDWIISPELAEKIKEKMYWDVTSFIGKDSNVREHAPQTDQKIMGSLEKEVTEMGNVFNSSSQWFADKDKFGWDLLRYILKKDLKFLRRKKGRSRGFGNETEAAFDPWLSHFQYYVLSENKTGIWEFDQMFRDLKRVYLETRNSGRFYKGYVMAVLNDSIDDCATIWRQKHPGRILFEVHDMK